MAQAARSMVPHPPGVKDGDSGWARIREQNARYWPRFSDSEYQRRYRESAISREGDPPVYAANVPAIFVPAGALTRRSTSSDVPWMANG